jgi:hypothetical protein
MPVDRSAATGCRCSRSGPVPREGVRTLSARNAVFSAAYNADFSYQVILSLTPGGSLEALGGVLA